MSSFDSVGTLLATIAHEITGGLRILGLADKRHWGQDEHEQVRALEVLLDDAKKDFQELSPLVNGQDYYENDRKHESIQELNLVREKLHTLIENIREWARSGGPINPIWVRETHLLQTELHRAQCRAARRIFTAEKETSVRCLGAFLVYRKQRQWASQRASEGELEYQRKYREELLACKKIGTFERFDNHDIAFVCDYCDGHIVWEDLESMPSIRTSLEAAEAPTSPTSATSSSSLAADAPDWQATGFTVSGHREKQVVYAPVAIANHMAPQHADYTAGLLCHYCDEASGQPQELYDEEEIYQPENAFEDLISLQEHLEWEHSGAPPVPAMSLPSAPQNCAVM